MKTRQKKRHEFFFFFFQVRLLFCTNRKKKKRNGGVELQNENNNSTYTTAPERRRCKNAALGSVSRTGQPNTKESQKIERKKWRERLDNGAVWKSADEGRSLKEKRSK